MRDPVTILSKEFQKCFTPASGKNVVCLIQTEKNEYTGHNIELEHPLYFFHAEEMAMAKMLDSESTPTIKKIITWGSGSPGSFSFKNATPCFDCFERLLLFMNTETKIEVIHSDILKGTLKLTTTDFQNAYAVQPETMVCGTTHQSIVDDLKAKTILTGIDLELIADIRLLGLREQIIFLLIGSTAGKGGTSKIVINKTGGPYNDIDLIALTPKDPTFVENEITSIIKRYYESCVLTKKECPVPSINATRLKRKFMCVKGNLNRLIELDIGDNLERILHKPEYIKRNWFHYLSR